MQTIKVSAKNVEEAVGKALLQLGGLKKEQVDIEVISEGSRGFLGFLGSKDAILKVTVKQSRVEKAQAFLAGTLRKMGITATLDLVEQTDNSVSLEINGQQLGSLIGRRGQTLDALQYLVNLVMNKKEEQKIRVIVDVAGYRKRREENLHSLAHRLAEKVQQKGESVFLEPMNAHERRIIHLALQDHPFVYTQSRGEDPERKIIICLRR